VVSRVILGQALSSELPFSASLAALPALADSGGKSTLITRGFMSSIIAKEPASTSNISPPELKFGLYFRRQMPEQFKEAAALKTLHDIIDLLEASTVINPA